MECCFCVSKPKIGRNIHLLQFAEISTSWLLGMSLFNSHQVFLDRISCFLCFRILFSSCHIFLIRFCLALVALGDSMYSDSRIEVIVENDFIVKYESGMTLMEIVAEGEISRRTAYRYLAYYKESQKQKEKT